MIKKKRGRGGVAIRQALPRRSVKTIGQPPHVVIPRVQPSRYFKPINYRWDLINLMIEKRGYKRYLEIGCFADECFNQIRAEIKVGVDPVSGGTVRKTSDDYFADARERGESFDIIFIDGLHHHDQVLRDVENALECLSPGGVILMHDCLPPSASFETDQKSGGVTMCGTVWRAVVRLRERSDIDVIVGNFDYGVGFVRKVPNPVPIHVDKTMDQLCYADFVANRDAWMRPSEPIVFHMLAERPWGKPTMAVLVLAKDDQEIEDFKKACPTVFDEARIVLVSNPGARHGYYAEIGNKFFAEATEDIVGIVHGDTRFGPGALEAFAQAAASGECVVGIVGRSIDVRYVWCCNGGGEVSTLDSCSVFFRRNLGLRFDGVTFDYFHCVVEDLCLQAAQLGIKAVAPNVPNASHIGNINTPPDWNQTFWTYRARLVEKWQGVQFATV